MRHPPTSTHPGLHPGTHPDASCGTQVTVHYHQVTGRLAGAGPVLAILTGSPADLAVAQAAAGWAAGTGSRVVAATVVTHTGFSLNPLLHQVRASRYEADSLAITARVFPVLTAAGVVWLRTLVAVPGRRGPARAPLLSAIRRLIDRFAAVAVVTTTPQHDNG
ncbi:hypothetical protein, partial [Nonomuraea dietziae]|uniref:hypothetical protein n=1 Tax=Nonomuraea dietziae TaxID=65515 RepID=UPI00343BE6BE